jgi:hypothetical protein
MLTIAVGKVLIFSEAEIEMENEEVLESQSFNCPIVQLALNRSWSGDNLRYARCYSTFSIEVRTTMSPLSQQYFAAAFRHVISIDARD